jgi:glyoxylase-like metal-dependent hydrolase (beta-lactamase superfamily II)
VVIRQLELGPMQNFVYLVGCARTREALVVDPAWEVDTLWNAAQEEGLRITTAVVTHRHGDHVNGLPELLERASVRVWAHRDDADELPLPPSEVTKAAGGERVRLGDVEVELVHTPGHTPGSQCLLVRGSLVTGDTLFVNGCGRCDLPGGDAKRMYDTLTRVLGALPADTRVLPGHNYDPRPTSTLGEERARNPFFQNADETAFVAFRALRSRRKTS